MTKIGRWGVLIAGFALSVPCDASAASVLYVYLLDGSYADELGGPDILPRGGTLESDGYSFGANQGLTLVNVLPDPASYSVAVRFRVNDVNGWRKLVDFKDLTEDSGLYNESGHVRFYLPDFRDDVSTLQAGVDFHLVLTRDRDTREVVAYLDGVERVVFSDTQGKAIFDDGSRSVLRFFQDDWATEGRESSGGFVDEILIFDGALTDVQVQDLYLRGVLPGDSTDPDSDGDGVPDAGDNCVAVANEDQLDSDADGFGDACDNCLLVPNDQQVDTDGDGFGDVCDKCSEMAGSQGDADGDGLGDVCDDCPLDPENDADGDGLCADQDTCPHSDVSPVLVADGPEGGVENVVLDSGCSMADQLAAVVAESDRPGALLTSVLRLTTEWRSAGLITRREQVAILLDTLEDQAESTKSKKSKKRGCGRGGRR